MEFDKFRWNLIALDRKVDRKSLFQGLIEVGKLLFESHHPKM